VDSGPRRCRAAPGLFHGPDASEIFWHMSCKFKWAAPAGTL
jgi:hypothetical protein